MGRRRQGGKSSRKARWHGVFNVRKPSGVTSREVVNVIQRQLRPSKVGHAGTLDPLAAGVLVVCVGTATRLIRLVQQLPKTYIAKFQLGAVSDTDDVEGVVRQVDSPLPTLEQVRSCLPSFLGQVMQRPPSYSAVRIGGKRAYAMAREGESVDLQPRPVRIDRVKLLEWQPPALTLRIDCGSGVYIRSIGRDLGQQLGCGAVMSDLERTAIGNFDEEQAVPLAALEEAHTADDLVQQLLPVGAAAAHLPQLVWDEPRLAKLGHGQRVPLDSQELALSDQVHPDVEWQICDQENRLRAIANVEHGAARATINLPRPTT